MLTRCGNRFVTYQLTSTGEFTLASKGFRDGSEFSSRLLSELINSRDAYTQESGADAVDSEADCPLGGQQCLTGPLHLLRDQFVSPILDPRLQGLSTDSIAD